MSNLIPPLLSSSPPPIVGPLDEEDDDEFGDFRAAPDSYDCDDFSLPPSPQKSPEKELKQDCSKSNLDINSNKSQKVTTITEVPTQKVNGSVFSEEVVKDFQDRRKNSDDIDDFKPSEIAVNCSDSTFVAFPTTFNFDTDKVVSYIDSSDELNEQIVDEGVNEQDLESQSCHDTSGDVFSDLQCAVPSSINDCDEIEPTSTVDMGLSKVDQIQSDCNSNSNEDYLFDAFSESVEEKTNNSDNLSELNELNEIKSEDDGIDEINFEITVGDNEKEDNSSKINDDNLSESSVSLKVCETDPKVSDDEFGDFEKHFANEFTVDPQGSKEDEEVADKIEEPSEDEFDDFVNPLPSSIESAEKEVDEDDFGDFETPEFGEFSSQTGEKIDYLEFNPKNIVDRSETILKDIFPTIQEEADEYEYTDGTNGNKIFYELKDVTETNALIYQWSKSNSQKMFLKSLNIDTRNILYGPAWNSSMPRFAANLGLTPLEPVKSEILTPTPVQNVSSPSNSSQKNNSDIPTAQFDWSGSGLINPLDSTSTVLPGNVPEDSPQTQFASDFLPNPSSKLGSVPGLFDTVEKVTEERTSPPEAENNIELPKPSSTQSDDFSSFHSPKLIPLRETHISTEMNDFSKPGWLQPTILTPDLPRKETVVDPDDDDEFDDFQMVLPEENKVPIEKPVETEFKNNVFSVPAVSEPEMRREEPSHNQEHIFEIPMSSGPIDSPVQKQPNDVNDDDEFTEFHSSVPQVNILKPFQPVPLEPLKPTVQGPTPVAQINWPDPGVTDEDIKNIELVYSRKTEPAVEETKSEVTKENSFEDDEWSDFISVTNPGKAMVFERTSTPDLPLSVLNLNNVQAPKQPIPVITPSGLVQTKLSSNIKSVVQTSVQPNLFKPPMTQFQPSIISNQFAANFFPAHNTGATTSSTKGQHQEDDDDWSDFVSGQPPPQVNGYQQKSSTKPPPMNWTSATTNIIMNPTHFETFQGYVTPQQSKKGSAMPPRNTIPSISAMPDLDFIAPKNRTSKK